MTQYYPKVIDLHMQDKVINLKVEMRLKMIEMHMVRCAKECGMFSVMSMGRYQEQWSTMKEEGKSVKLDRCFFCQGVLLEEVKLAYKLYFSYDKRIKIEQFINGLFVHGAGSSTFSLTFRSSKGRWWEKNRSMKFALFESFDDVVSCLQTIRQRPEDKKTRNPWKITLKVLEIPSKEQMQVLFDDYKKRKLIEAI